VVTHHKKNKVFSLNHHEVLFISKNNWHVISISLDNEGHKIESYININKVPIKTETGWIWEDLELDLKVIECKIHGSIIALLDLKEFEEKNFDIATTNMIFDEIDNMIKNISGQNFPFRINKNTYFNLPKIIFQQNFLYSQS
jgi:predicted RNA-binding protein associated with RNAse of E/G family